MNKVTLAVITLPIVKKLTQRLNEYKVTEIKTYPNNRIQIFGTKSNGKKTLIHNVILNKHGYLIEGDVC